MTAPRPVLPVCPICTRPAGIGQVGAKNGVHVWCLSIAGTKAAAAKRAAEKAARPVKVRTCPVCSEPVERNQIGRPRRVHAECKAQRKAALERAREAQDMEKAREQERKWNATARAKARAEKAQAEAANASRWMKQRQRRDARLRMAEAAPEWTPAFEAQVAAHAAGMADFLRGKR